MIIYGMMSCFGPSDAIRESTASTKIYGTYKFLSPWSSQSKWETSIMGRLDASIGMEILCPTTENHWMSSADSTIFPQTKLLQFASSRFIALWKETTKRTAPCMNCEKLVNIKQMCECGYCKISQYCSIECAIAQWPDHKGSCKCLRKLRKPKYDIEEVD